MNSLEQDLLLTKIAGILIRCFFMTIILLTIWFLVFVCAREAVYEMHSRWFDLDWNDYNIIFYFGMAFLKIIAFVFFLFPYVAIRLILLKNKT